MGTDIHCVFQRRDKASGRWVDVTSEYGEERHYQLFAVLAGVRNGVGFAGMKTGEPVAPISPPRGLPEDFQVDDVGDHTVESVSLLPERRRKYADVLAVWMGEHSHSWLTGDELISWFENAPTVTQTGVVSRETYNQWDGVSRPKEYCGGVSGGGVVVVDDTEEARRQAPGWNYIRVSWESGLREELAYFFNEVNRLIDEHGEVRFVFGFDS